MKLYRHIFDGINRRIYELPISLFVLAWRRVNRRIYETPTCLFAGLEQIYQEIL